ncbi:MAG: prepilin-type N-terminal cleavage/methylation domain-containing protein [Calditrichaeota bacterium]|nr:MAG: prepilin-type N-terminal cleavage/methylation domain-containing protein [Calditrichota bacterium]
MSISENIKETNMKISKKMNQKGLTILEVLVAMIILSMSLLVLLNMAMVALDGNDWSNKTTIATQLMQEKMEQLRNIPGLSSSYSGTDTASGVSRVWKVTNADNHLRKVIVAVTYENIKGDQVTNELTSYIKTDSL